MKKFKFAIVCCVVAILAFSLAACGSDGSEKFGSFTLKADGSYSFTGSGAASYSLNVYKTDDFDAANKKPVDGADAKATAKLSKTSGKDAQIAALPFGRYTATLSPAGSDEIAVASFVKGGKLSVPEFCVFAGVAMNMGPKPDDGGAPAAQADEGETPAPPAGGDTETKTPKLHIVINTDNYLAKIAYPTEAVYSFAYEVYADKAMTSKLYSQAKFADNIEPAGFTLYTNNEATIDLEDKYWTADSVTWYVRVKANGNAEDEVVESDWSELMEITFDNTSTVPFDYGFGRPSQMGNFGDKEE